jgi:hypothetical protein
MSCKRRVIFIVHASFLRLTFELYPFASYHSCLPQLGREVLDLAASHARPGITTDEIDTIVHQATIDRNAYPSPLGYRKFPKSVCTYAIIRLL